MAQRFEILPYPRQGPQGPTYFGIYPAASAPRDMFLCLLHTIQYLTNLKSWLLMATLLWRCYHWVINNMLHIIRFHRVLNISIVVSHRAQFWDRYYFNWSTQILFADDTNLFYKNPDQSIFEDQINNELKHVSLWLKVNMHSLNVSKTHCIIFTWKSKTATWLNIGIDNEIMNEVDKTQFLRVTKYTFHVWFKSFVQMFSMFFVFCCSQLYYFDVVRNPVYNLFHHLLCKYVKDVAGSKSNHVMVQIKSSDMMSGCCIIQLIALWQKLTSTFTHWIVTD